MAQKNERTSFNVSNNLKTALQAKGLYPEVEAGQAFYEGSATKAFIKVVNLLQ